MRFLIGGIVSLGLSLFIYSTVFANDSIENIFNYYEENSNYHVYQNDEFLRSFSDYDEAVEYAKLWSHSTVIYNGLIWHNTNGIDEQVVLPSIGNTTIKTEPMAIFQDDILLAYKENFQDACAYAKLYANSFVGGAIPVWDNYEQYYYIENNLRVSCSTVQDYIKIKKSYPNISPLYYSNSDNIAYEKTYECNHIIKNVPEIAQNPQLPRGCEVTSLAMILNYNGINVSKMKLADEIVKIPYKEDPNKGFIGDMYSLRTFGLGVYHTPIKNLAENYVGNRVLDLTGCEFEDLYYYIKNNKPVWVINNSRFRYLDDSYFNYWNTPSGVIKITYKEHSVVITGIDNNYVYINDPLTGGSRKLNKSNFIAGWKQMGSQCIVIN